MSLTIVGIGLLRCLSVRKRRGVSLLWVRVAWLGEEEGGGRACSGDEGCEAVICRTVGVHVGTVQGG